jgi:hypothetical protein
MKRCPTCAQELSKKLAVKLAAAELHRRLFAWTFTTLAVWGVFLSGISPTWTLAWWTAHKHVLVMLWLPTVISLYLWVQFFWSGFLRFADDCGGGFEPVPPPPIPDGFEPVRAPPPPPRPPIQPYTDYMSKRSDALFKGPGTSGAVPPPHKWAFRCLYTTTAGDTYELLRCEHCKEEKLGERRPGEHGAMGPYNVYNGRETCTPPEARQKREREARAEWEAFRAREEAALAERRARVAAMAQAAGKSIEDYPFSREEARALYEAGRNYEDGGGGSFEEALRELGR